MYTNPLPKNATVIVHAWLNIFFNMSVTYGYRLAGDRIRK